MLGLVVRTGFTTTKGALVRDILHPKPYKYHFYRDALIVVFFMFLLCIIGYVVTFQDLVDLGVSRKVLIMDFLNLVGVSIPAFLPIFMSFS